MAVDPNFVNTLHQRGNAILRRCPDPHKGVEVGVLMGALSRYLLLKTQNLKLFMVDNWEVEANQPDHYKATRDIHSMHDAATVLRHRTASYKTANAFGRRAKIVEMASIEAAKLFDDGSMDFVFLDADHSYKGVSADLKAWVPKVKPGGWICGHDYLNDSPDFSFEVTRAVDNWAKRTGAEIEPDENFTWFARL